MLDAARTRRRHPPNSPIAMNIKHTLPLILMLALATPAIGQETPLPSHRLTLTGYGLYDFHYATGDIGGGALQLAWHVSPTFSLEAGAEYASSNRIAAKLSGEATLLTTPQGRRLTLRNSYLWRHFPQLDLQEFTGALQVGWHARHIQLHLGLCNRYTAALIQRSDGGRGTVFEPMNVMFAAEGWWYNLLTPHAWNIGLRWSNYNDFIIERVANWFFSAKALYTLPKGADLYAEVGIHPVGSLNLTASYDGWFLHLGATKQL